jgi:hypothetical protein
MRPNNPFIAIKFKVFPKIDHSSKETIAGSNPDNIVFKQDNICAILVEKGGCQRTR